MPRLTDVFPDQDDSDHLEEGDIVDVLRPDGSLNYVGIFEGWADEQCESAKVRERPPGPRLSSSGPYGASDIETVPASQVRRHRSTPPDQDPPDTWFGDD